MPKILTVILIQAGLLFLAGCAQESAPPAAATDEAAAASEAAAAATDAAKATADEVATAATAPLLTGDPEAGKRIYIFCQSCHSLNEGGSNKVGPNLYGIAGAQAAQVEGFVYSEALMNAGVTWTAEALDQWITRPAQMVPGTTMIFAGVRDPQQRADLIAYLQQAGPAN